MKTFEYTAAESIMHASEQLSRWSGSASILAGGTDLLIALRHANGSSPKCLIDISRIPELRGITLKGDTVTIRPLTVHAELEKSSCICLHAPFLSRAASMIGSPQIRNRGTVGGNIMNAATCADTVPPLIALGAGISLKSVRGTRRMPLEQLFTAPYATTAATDEILEEIVFPVLPTGATSAFIKLGRRNALSIARLSIAAVLEFDSGGKIKDARIVPGAAFPTWRRMSEAEHLLRGEIPSTKLFEDAGKAVAAAMISETGMRWSTAYKEPVLVTLVTRALQECECCRRKEQFER
ncbi:MAG TPA: FAD binding domain-containing protein [Bacteroidota bacterium]|nr:FAD binding domain-containing protein [Bacteroidota bacterium]